jgi:hypothetical protein
LCSAHQGDEGIKDSGDYSALFVDLDVDNAGGQHDEPSEVDLQQSALIRDAEGEEVQEEHGSVQDQRDA